jgi:hypothetical protein
MKIKEFFSSLPLYFQAGVVPCIVAQHGVGKSSVVAQYTREMGIEFRDVRLGQMADPGDLMGLPEIVGGKTRFNPTTLLPTSGEGVLFLDEINRCGKDLSQAVFQLVLDRKLGEYTLPDGWNIVAAMNPDSAEYAVSSFDDQAFLDRFAMIRLEPSVAEFTGYARTKGHSAVADFIGENPQFLENKVEFSVTVTPSRRSWEAVGRIQSGGLDENLRLPVFSSIVGVEAAASYIQYLDSQDVITWERVLNGWNKKMEKSVAKLDAGSVGNLIDQMEAWGKGLPVTGMYSADHDTKTAKAMADSEKVLVAFLKAIPKDAAYAAIYSRMILNPAFVGTPMNQLAGFIDHPEFREYFEKVGG